MVTSFLIFLIFIIAAGIYDKTNKNGYLIDDIHLNAHKKITSCTPQTVQPHNIQSHNIQSPDNHPAVVTESSYSAYDSSTMALHQAEIEKITPENRYIKGNENPPKVIIKFFKDLIDIKNINCYSNEGNIWRKSDIEFTNESELKILLKEKFKSERGRINCSLWAEKNRWRWLGIQYVIAEY